MNSAYTYQIYLHSSELCPAMEKHEKQTLASNINKYTIKYTTASESVMLEVLIKEVEKLNNYKMIIIGEHEGHVEVYKSENYEGNLRVEVKYD